MTDAAVLVERARQAAARGEWPTTHDALSAARDGTHGSAHDLGLDDLRLLAEAAWWLGHGARSMALAEEVYHRLDDEGRLDEAARQALILSLEWVTRGDVGIGAAWLGRARRLLEGAPSSATHGYLRYVDASFEMDVYGDPCSADAAAAEVEAMGRAHADPALTCFARVLEGLAAVRSGRTTEGFAALDEAMLEVLAGRLPPLWSGDIYCTVIHLSHQLGDWGRMRAWTDALDRWATPLSRTFLYAHVTRVHQLQLMAAEGGWARVETDMATPSEQLVGSHGWLAGAGYQELGDVRRLRGDGPGAAAAYGRARELGTEPQPGEALMAYAAGRPGEAATMLRAALVGHGALERARLLLPAVEVGLAAGDQELAVSSAAELAATADRYGTPGLLAWARHAEGLLALDDGRWADAVDRLESALAAYRSQRLRHGMARVHEQLAAARRGLGQDMGAAADEATALTIYRQLGAAPDVERLGASSRPGGLTVREEEILALVVSGASNRDVAQRLVISEKTVSRHLANVFAKIGVGSRTAASAWAHAHGIHGSPHAPA